ncbi:uncharacterized protein TNCT_131721 [Trichonephila clavata]|uniref:Uncharacterized protein n=1 Tax=Trichonephila clavata TaxID=2740835 RepID=A0A8X6GH65_TRICU|nr:uncharacterized protein TNCT_131721 [Trichonephila clavata]
MDIQPQSDSARRRKISPTYNWYSHGVIDRFETAEVLVRKESIEIQDRFVLACKYYLEDQEDKSQNKDITDSIQMYHNRTEIETFYENYLGLRCYFKKLGPQARYRCLSYSLLVGEMHHFDLYLYFSELTFDEAKDLFRHLSASRRLRDYGVILRKLGPQARYRCLSYSLLVGEMHHFDLYLCFSELTIEEVQDLFRHLSASKHLRVMELFLRWPL